METRPTVFRTEGLSIGYETDAGLVPAVRDATMRIAPRECYGLVGESGSGKTTLAMGAIGCLGDNGRIICGSARLGDIELTGLSRARMRSIWGRRIGMVCQNPFTALNPSLRIGRQLCEGVRAHLGLSRGEARHTALEMLARVAMPDPEGVLGRYPHQLSGGMLQRCVIAMALSTGPEMLILDEPTIALDVTTQAVVLDLVRRLKSQLDSSILYITHDLAAVSRLCDRVGVMYAGRICEQAPMRELYKRPLHPYTLGLLGCMPRFDPGASRRLRAGIPGLMPRPDELPKGCIFAPRCVFARPECARGRPPMVEVMPGRSTSCFRWKALPSAAEYVRAAPEIPPYVEQRPEVLRVQNIDGVTLSVRKGETLGVLGESGCGKTTLLRAVAGLAPRTSGEISLGGRSVEAAVARRTRSTLKALQMVFQNPEASLNPRHSVGRAIGRPLLLLARVPRREVPARVRALLEAVNLPESCARRLPEELSPGEKQRAAIARALAAEPEVILLDDPLSSLDVSVQASLANLLTRLQESSGVSYLFISRDLAAVQHLSHRIAVMYLGSLVEWGDTTDVFTPPFHPYTETLLSAIPVADPDITQKPIRREGNVPRALSVPAGCRFNARCPRKLGGICEAETPPWREERKDHRIACHIPLEELTRLQADTIVRADSAHVTDSARAGDTTETPE